MTMIPPPPGDHPSPQDPHLPWGMAAPQRPSFRSRLHRLLRPRRVLGLLLMLAMAYGVFHLVFLTDLLDPVLAHTDQIRRGVDWVTEDPSRVVVALAAFALPHIGLYYLLFEDR